MHKHSAASFGIQTTEVIQTQNISRTELHCSNIHRHGDILDNTTHTQLFHKTNQITNEVNNISFVVGITHIRGAHGRANTHQRQHDHNITGTIACDRANLGQCNRQDNSKERSNNDT
jgi:hypothetical protein